MLGTSSEGTSGSQGRTRSLLALVVARLSRCLPWSFHRSKSLSRHLQHLAEAKGKKLTSIWDRSEGEVQALFCFIRFVDAAASASATGVKLSCLEPVAMFTLCVKHTAVPRKLKGAEFVYFCARTLLIILLLGSSRYHDYGGFDTLLMISADVVDSD